MDWEYHCRSHSGRRVICSYARKATSESSKHRTMFNARSTKPKSGEQEFPWYGRFYAIRILFTAMVLLMLVINDTACDINRAGGHLWLLLAGASYPHVAHLLLGRFEGRRKRGHIVFVIDGLFSGAVMAALGPFSAPSAVLSAINLFNWMATGGPVLAALGMVAAVAGFALSGTHAATPAVSACTATDALAAAALIGYFFFVARFINLHVTRLRQQQAQFQTELDATIRTRKLADQALLAVLPASAAELLAETGQLATRMHGTATILIVEFVQERAEELTIAKLADCFQACDAIFGRHGFECVKTYGRKYLAMSLSEAGPDEAVAASQEVRAFLSDHHALVTTSTPHRLVRSVVHSGKVSTGLVQPSRLNFELAGDAMETLDAMAASTSNWPNDAIVISGATRSRMSNAEGFEVISDETGLPTYLRRLDALP